MAETVPFKGVYYDAERANIDRVVAPPYDVLSPAQQDALYARDDANIVRIMLNRETSEDDSTNNRYSRAAQHLREWLDSGTLHQDASPAYYESIQRFHHPLDPSQMVDRSTLFVALRLEPYERGVVLPHEETHPKAKADRLQLMRATRANPEPIYGLYEDPDHSIETLLQTSRGEAPLLRTSVPPTPGAAPDEHLLYRHGSETVVRDISARFASRRVWIADGHHRYETALNYQRERREAEGNPPEPRPFDYILIGLSAFEDPGLVVLPTHRLVRNVPAERLEALESELARSFGVTRMSVDAARSWIAEMIPGSRRFALLQKGGAYALTLTSLEEAAAASPGEHCDAWRRLDVTILQTLVLDRALGIPWTELAHTPDVAYTRDAGEAAARVASGEFRIACLLQNPTVEGVRDVASAGDKMPQKSTFFYPKLWSGIILRLLD